MLLCEAKVVFALFCHLAVIYSCLIASTVCTLPACTFCLIQDDRKHHAPSHSMLVNYMLHFEAVRLKSWIKTSSRCRRNRYDFILVLFWHLILPTVKAITLRNHHLYPDVNAGLDSTGSCSRHSFLWKESWFWYNTKKKHRMTITVREEKCQKYYRLWDTFLLRWMLPVMTGDGKGNCIVYCIFYIFVKLVI